MARARILLIEDDPAIAEMYRLRLEAPGWQVEVAYDGESGLRVALDSPPDLVLLDMMLPALDGIGVLHAMRANQQTQEVPVLVISNSAGLTGKETEARQLGIEDWLVKSKTTPGQLAERAALILDRQRQDA